MTCRRGPRSRLVDPRYEEIVTRVTIVAGKKTVLHEAMKKELPRQNRRSGAFGLRIPTISPLYT